jgi:predicted nucleic acid-binding protein
MSAGLDTSVLLRLLTGMPADQAKRALDDIQERISRSEAIVVSDLVIAETYFALHYHYQVPKAEALKLLEAFLAESGVSSLGFALRVLGTPNLATANPGFVDRLIHAEYAAKAGLMLTFEKKAARLPCVNVL